MDTKPSTSEPWRQSPASRPHDSLDLPSPSLSDIRSQNNSSLHPAQLSLPAHPPHFPNLAHPSSLPLSNAAPSLLQPDRRIPDLSPPDELPLQPMPPPKQRPFPPDIPQQDWRRGPLHHSRSLPPHSASPASLQDAYIITQDSARKRPRHPQPSPIPPERIPSPSRHSLTYLPSYDAEARHVHASQTGTPPPPLNRTSLPIRTSYAPPDLPSRRIPTPDDSSFLVAAEAGARAQFAVDNASGEGVLETYKLGISIVRSSKLYANQRRSNRLLPGGSDSTTAACYMIGGTPDSVLSPLLARVSPCDPREERCKAVERVLKDKTRGAICALNGENPREARADNLAAVRICEVVADILVAHSSRRLMESRMELFATVSRQDTVIKELREQIEVLRREKDLTVDPSPDSAKTDNTAVHSNKYGIS